MIRKQLTVFLQNKPGALAKTTQAIAEAGVNIDAISVVEHTEIGVVRILASNPAAAKRVMEGLRIPFMEEDVAVVTLENSPGSLAAWAKKVADAGININYVYGGASGIPNGAHCQLVINAVNLHEAEALCGG